MNWKNGRKTILVECDNCHIEFEKTLSEYNRTIKLNRNHYCSIKCSRESKKRTIKHCLHCGNEIKSYDVRTKYCSQSCASKYSNVRRKPSEKTKEKTKQKLKEYWSLKPEQRKIVSEYNKKPKYCRYCKRKLPYEKKNRVFCDKICQKKYGRRNAHKMFNYRKLCSFNFNVYHYPEEFNIELLNRNGWYSSTNGGNEKGIVRDHIFSVKEGFKRKIDPDIIKHPANCVLITQEKNRKKGTKSTITLKELKKKILMWDDKYNNMGQ